MKTNQQTTTFNDILEDVAEAIPGYRRIIFKIITIALVIGKGEKTYFDCFCGFLNSDYRHSNHPETFL